MPGDSATGYDILIQPGALGAMPALLAERGLEDGRVFIGTNETLAPLYGRALAERTGGIAITLPDGEQYKTLETAAAVYSGLAQLGMDRSSIFVALGGGVIGDTVGFIAATYMRGVRFVQAPTSLLAMVDASVGGKVGVDLKEGKNLVGAFKQPEAVIIDPDVLATLPDIEWRCGLAETIKHGLLADPSLLEPDTLRRENVTDWLPRAIQVKVDVVQQDPYEKNVRAHLNLGHTFAHALEHLSGYTWRHGEAVAVGLVAALRLSAALRLCSPELVMEIEGLLKAVGLPTSLGRYTPQNIWQQMATDKKYKNGQPRLVLLNGIGKPRIMEGIDAAQVIGVLEGMRDS